MDLQLNGRTALVTGSSKGIGEAIALTLAREGARVIVHGRDPAAAHSVVETITRRGGHATAVLGDLTVNAEVEQLVSQAEDRVGPVEILVNNAGGSGPKRDWHSSVPEEWMETYDRNVLAAVRLTTRVLPKMRLAGWGRVINISSAAGTMPPDTGAEYSAAKAAMNAMTVSLARAVATNGVTVNTVSPGTIRSGRLEAAFRERASQRGTIPANAPWDAVQAEVLSLFAHVPMGRVGELSEVADAVAFLASPLAAYLTGMNMRVDGGMSPTV